MDFWRLKKNQSLQCVLHTLGKCFLRRWGRGGGPVNHRPHQGILANTLSWDDRPKIDFATPSGLYHFTKMPFGLNGASASFQRVMDKTLIQVQDCEMPYIDDILVFSLCWEAHIGHLKRVLEAFRKVGLTANLKKSKLRRTVVQYLGFCIG